MLITNGHDIFLGGTEGIGKSVFTEILAFLLVEEGKVVVMEHFDERLLLVALNSSEDAINELKGILEDQSYDSGNIIKSGIYEIPKTDEDLFLKLAKALHLILIQNLDSVQRNTVNFDGDSRKIWISSPNSEKLRPIKDYGALVQLCLPPPDVEELLAIRNHWNPNNYTEEDVRERVLLYGKSIRYVIGFSREQAKAGLERDITEANKRMLSQVFGTPLLHLPKSAMSGVLLQAFPMMDAPRAFQLRFASDKIRERLFDKFVTTEQRSALVFLEVARKHIGLAAFAGMVLEDTLHDYMLQGVMVQLKSLVPIPGATRSIQFPKLDLKQLFESTTFDDVILTNVVENAYFRPRSQTFPTIDSFAILPLSMFEPGETGEKGLCLVTFQSPVSKTQKTQGVYLERLFDRIKAGPALSRTRRFHVFWTSTEGFNTMQKVDIEDVAGGAYEEGFGPKVEQWALTIGPELDELFKKVEELRERSLLY